MGKSRNPYVVKGGPRLKRSVVALVDLLGYADLVRESRDSNAVDKLLKKLHRALKKARKHVDPRKKEDIFNTLHENDFSAFRAFTDNIVIGHPFSEDGEIELAAAFNELSYFQMMMTMEGFFVRGAIAIGDIYIDNIAVFGPALIEAYRAEQDLARDPRIVLTASAREAVSQHLSYYGHGQNAPQVRDLLEDSDGQFFVNYLDTIVAEDGQFFRKELLRHRSAIEGNLSKYRNRPTVWSKYVWAARYHNYFCTLHPAVDRDCEISPDKYQAAPKLIVE